jgi:cyclopropane fatty-acyl-phospholipid synthase-like methyltransferase
VSTRALETAQTNLAVLNCEKTFINGDMNRSIQGYQNNVDVIITGYSLHHLCQSEKALFFKHCYAALNPGGVYLLYDLTALETEDREQCLHRHWSVYQQWDFDDQDHALVKEHVFEQDFPETKQTLMTMAEAQGFIHNKVLYTDENKIFSAFCFYK